MSYFAHFAPVERGREGERPRTLHRFAPGSSTRTRCGLPTDNGTSIHSEDDTYCADCEEESA